MLITPVLASVEKQAMPFNVQVKFGLPNEGFLDSFHDAKTNRGQDREFAFYALRNIAVMKLLKTRRALSEILGTESEIRYLNEKYGHEDRAFEVPGSVKKLYQEKNEILEISEDINWLEEDHGEVNWQQLDDVTSGLVALSVQVVRYDNLLKYVRTDMWKEYFSDPLARKHLRKKYYDRHGVGEVELFLQGQRDGLLYRYHFLAQEEKKIPLYKRIYDLLEKEYDFPSAKMVQSQKNGQKVFRQELKNIDVINHPVELPTQFEDALNFSIKDNLSYPLAKNKVMDAVTPLVKKALALALKENYEALDKLATPVNYEDDKDVFHYLGLNESLWNEAEKYYAHLNKKHVDFNKAYLQHYTFMNDSNLRKETLKRVGVQIGIALAVVSAMFTGGSSLAAGGAVAGGTGAAAGTAASLATAASWTGAASTVLLLTQSTYSYLDAKKHSELTKNLFLGSKDLSSLEESKYYAQIERSEFRNILLTLILVGTSTATIRALSTGRKIIVQGFKEFVPVTSKEFQVIQKFLQNSKAQLSLYGQLGKLLIRNNAQALMRLTGTTQKVAQLEDLIAKGARVAGISVNRAKEILSTIPQMQKIMGWYTAKKVADPLFMNKLLRGIVIDLAMHISAEYMVRGENFWNELDYVAINGLVGLIIIMHLTVKTTVSVSEPKLMFNVLLDKRGGFFAQGLSSAQRMSVLKETFRLFYTPAKELAMVAGTTSFVVSGVVETMEHYKDPSQEDAQKRLERVIMTSIYYAIFNGLISNVGTQFMNSWLEPKVAMKLGQDALKRRGIIAGSPDAIMDAVKISPTHNMLMLGMSTSETFMENALFSWGITSSGIQSDEEEQQYEEDLDGVFFRLNPNQNHASYLFDFLASAQ